MSRGVRIILKNSHEFGCSTDSDYIVSNWIAFFLFCSSFFQAISCALGSFLQSFTFITFKNSYRFQSKFVHLFDLSQIIWPIFHVKRNFFHKNATEKVHHLFVVMLDLIRSIIQARLKFKLCIVIELDSDFVSITTHNAGSNE